MDLAGLRSLVRTLADELTEYPEGLFTNDSLDILINLSQNNVLLDLINRFPRYFRKTVLIDLAASTRIYDVEDDFELDKARFIGFESILHNKDNEEPLPLLEIEPDQEGECVYVGQVESDPLFWGYEGHGVIFIVPMVSSAMTARLKGFYFEFLEDLEDDDDCQLPICAMELVALDVLKKWAIREEGSTANIEARYQFILQSISLNLPISSTFKESGPRPDIREVLKKQYEYTGIKTS